MEFVFTGNFGSRVFRSSWELATGVPTIPVGVITVCHRRATKRSGRPTIATPTILLVESEGSAHPIHDRRIRSGHATRDAQKLADSVRTLIKTSFKFSIWRLRQAFVRSRHTGIPNLREFSAGLGPFD